MSARKPIFHKYLFLLLLALPLICGTSGCKLATLLGGRAGLPVGYTGPSVEGRWTGRIVSVDVYDNDGRRYGAPALQIVSGPQMPGGAHEKLGSGKHPILVVRHDDIYRVSNTAQFPEAKLVEVSGTMISERVRVDADSPQQDEIVSRVRDGQMYNEHLLVIAGPPVILQH